MPVTQTRNASKSSPEQAKVKAPKAASSPVRLHAPGFNVSINPSADHERKAEAHAAETTVKHPRRRVSALNGTSYSFADQYSEFFVATPAFHGAGYVPQLHNTYLRPNAKFVGEQQSGSSSYDIKVEIKNVDLLSSVVTGFFQIKGLTDEHPLITTCFKGEIINNPLSLSELGRTSLPPKRYSFITEENNWSSFPKNDLEHWKKLTGSPSHFSEHQLRERLNLIQSGARDPSYIYMRWKEEFLLPDSRVKSLTGASFEGFYYVVLNIGNGPEAPASDSFSTSIIPGAMSGLYFYTQSEKFQSLSLRYVEDRGESHTFDFV